MRTRCWLRLAGLNVALSGTDLRGPVLNVQTTLSVIPSKWQLEHDCQPACESRSLVAVVWPPSVLLNSPRDEKNMSAPTATTSSCEPGAGPGAVWTTRMTRSRRRSTTETLRDSALLTYARVPAGLMAIPCGFLAALAPAVAGLAGSARSMSRVVSASTVLLSVPMAATLTLMRRSLAAETT